GRSRGSEPNCWLARFPRSPTRNRADDEEWLAAFGDGGGEGSVDGFEGPVFAAGEVAEEGAALAGVGIDHGALEGWVFRFERSNHTRGGGCLVQAKHHFLWCLR